MVAPYSTSYPYLAAAEALAPTGITYGQVLTFADELEQIGGYLNERSLNNWQFCVWMAWAREMERRKKELAAS